MPSFHHNSIVRSAIAMLALGALLLQGTFPYAVYAETEADATAISGDASAVAEIITDVNSSEIEEAPPEPTEAGDPVNPEASILSGDEHETGESATETIDIPEGATDGAETDIHATNTASTSVQATTTAESGSANAAGDSALAVSGEATAVIDVLNVVNTNIVDSQGLIDFINDTLGYDDFDLRSDFEYAFSPQDTAQSTAPCTLEVCAGTTDTNISNDATIENDLVVRATSGSTTAAGDVTAAVSGDAYASANVINIANTNITDSQYLLLVFNNFDDYAGDIILPNSSFFAQLFNTAPASTPNTISLDNQATVTDNLEVGANSGAASAEGADTLAVSGDSYTSGVSSNLINQNLIGGTSFSMLIRVHGDWSGSISGLPDGMTWRETDEGIELIYEGAGGGTNAASALSLSNNAHITNNVRVYALSGDSKAAGDEALAASGDAYANASIMNIANTNVISSNWTNLIFTIYGNWSGNLMFGQPDLWLGIQADSPDEQLMPGSLIDYTFTVFNQGDTTAHNVTLEGLFDASGLSFPSGNAGSGHTNWSLGDIAAGGTREVRYQATVSSGLSRSTITALPLKAIVSATEHESDYTNNEDTITVYVGNERSSHGSSGRTFPAHFDITKTADRHQVGTGEQVHYTVTFFNRGGQLFDAVLVDSLSNEEGEEVLTQSWPLGEIKNWETITIEYDIQYNSDLEVGSYTNEAQLVGFHESTRQKDQTPYESDIAQVTVEYGGPGGRVLGISTSGCTQYLRDYLHSGWNNDRFEVRKLQMFLNRHMNSMLAVSGVFDSNTEAAVKRFQRQYQSEVLDPWGDPTPTGFVYFTTQKKINELQCGNEQQFPLTSTQQAKIAISHSRWLIAQQPRR